MALRVALQERFLGFSRIRNTNHIQRPGCLLRKLRKPQYMGTGVVNLVVSVTLQRAPQFMHQSRFELNRVIVRCAQCLPDNALKIIRIVWQSNAMAPTVIDERKRVRGHAPQIDAGKPTRLAQGAVEQRETATLRDNRVGNRCGLGP